MEKNDEIYAIIKDFDNYAISNYGNVINIKTNKGMKICSTILYPDVGLSRNGKNYTSRIHRLLGIAFIPNPLNLPMIDHIDRNKHNNSLDNLRWISSSNNNRNVDKRENCISKHFGVSYHKGSKLFVARIRINTKLKLIGSFKTEDEAGIAFNNYITSNPDLTEFYTLNVIH